MDKGSNVGDFTASAKIANDGLRTSVSVVGLKQSCNTSDSKVE